VKAYQFFYAAWNPIAAIIQTSLPCCLINVCARLCVSVANVLGSPRSVMTHELVDHCLFAFALYLHSAELLHLISPGHQIMGCLAQDDITCELLGQPLDPGSKIHSISHQCIRTPFFTTDDAR